MEKIELKTVEEKQAACIFHAIPVASVGEDMGALLRQIFEWEVKNNLQMSGRRSLYITAVRKKYSEEN